MALWITIHIPRFGLIDSHTNLYMEQCLQAQKLCSRSKSSYCLRSATAEFHCSSATYSIMKLWATILILRFRFIDFHTNLYVEQCFHPHKPCSRPKSPFCTRRSSAKTKICVRRILERHMRRVASGSVRKVGLRQAQKFKFRFWRNLTETVVPDASWRFLTHLTHLTSEMHLTYDFRFRWCSSMPILFSLRSFSSRWAGGCE